MAQTSVYIVDDDEAVRDSLNVLLLTHDYNPKLYPSGEAFIEADLGSITGPILLDVRMPGRDGLEILKIALSRNPTLKVIMMSGHADVSMAVRALKNGATDFIEKPFSAKDMLVVLELATAKVENNPPLSATQQEARDTLAKLTPRESQIVSCLVKGQPNKVIAHELGISVRTVETHRAHVMSKLDIRSLSDLVKLSLAAE
ncbi:response regulator transcription factor [Litorimonas sp. RW-G-Af-16]|uniref:response regulator transcription factor n=1 Tax=Litorimonas sp. RW-G-Af-16 TaxID=3241168 RepID=UPI00390CC374